MVRALFSPMDWDIPRLDWTRKQINEHRDAKDGSVLKRSGSIEQLWFRIA